MLEIVDGSGIEALDLGGAIGEEEIFVAFPGFAIKEQLLVSQRITTSHC